MLHKSISMVGFQSFKKPTTFCFSDFGSGLHFLTGKNKAEPELGGNGAGKSSLWNALCWCYFGRTPRGIKAEDVCCWYGEGKECWVEVTGTYFGEKHIIRRQRNPIALTIDGEDVTQEQLEKVIGLSFQAFLFSIIFAQLSQSFLDLRMGERAEVFSKVLNLDYWLELSQKAKNEKVGVNIKWTEVDRKLLARRISLKQARENLGEVKESISEWEKEQLGSLEQLELDKKALKDGLLECAEALKECSRKIKVAKKKIASTEKEITSKSKELQTVQYQIREARQTSRDLKDRRVDLVHTAKVGKSGSSKNGKMCVVCGAQLSESRRRHLLQYFEDQIDEVDGKITAVEKALHPMLRTEDSLTGSISSLNRRLRAARATLIEWESNRTHWEKESERIGIELKQLDSDAKKTKSLANPYASQKTSFEKAIAHSKKEIARLKGKEKILKETEAHLEYWVDGFKKLRLVCINEALLDLNLEVNRCLPILGLSDWEIIFSMEKENKSGTVKPGFSVVVKSPYNKRAVPWEAWSGGESQRLRLAASMGFASLILNRKGIQSNIEVWDEPSSWLSEEGINGLLEVLEERSVELGKQIWVVDHRSLSFGGFSNIISVEKGRQGSVIRRR